MLDTTFPWKIEISVMEFGIPNGRSALSFLARSRYQQELLSGDVCKEDGYVYRNGKRTFKWFDYIVPECSNTGLRVFLGALDDIKRIEALYWKAVSLRQVHHQKQWPGLLQEMVQKKKAAYVPDEDEGWDYTHYLYETSTYAGGDSVREHGWKKTPVPEDACQDLGKRYWNFWQRNFQLSGRVSRIKAVLERAFEKTLPQLIKHCNTEEEHRAQQQKISMELGKMHRIKINGRYYWYQFTSNKYSGTGWTPHYWPDTELSEHDLDEI